MNVCKVPEPIACAHKSWDGICRALKCQFQHIQPQPWEEVCGEHELPGRNIRVELCEQGGFKVFFGSDEKWYGLKESLPGLADLFTRLHAANEARKAHERGECPNLEPKGSALDALMGKHELRCGFMADIQKRPDGEISLGLYARGGKDHRMTLSSSFSLPALLALCRRLDDAMRQDAEVKP